MSVLTFFYVGVAILNLVVIMAHMEPDAIARIQTNIRSGLGDIAAYGGSTYITDIDSFWTWLIVVGNRFYSDYNIKLNKYIYTNFLNIYPSLLIYQYKRSSCSSTIKHCFGDASLPTTGNIFETGIERIYLQFLTNSSILPDMEYKFFTHSYFQPIRKQIYDFSQENWINVNTSRVYVVMVFNNPSLLINTLATAAVDFPLTGYITTDIDIYSFASELNHRPGADGYIAAQAIGFIGIIALAIYEISRLTLKLRKKKTLPATDVIVGLGSFVSLMITVASLVMWAVLLTNQNFNTFDFIFHTPVTNTLTFLDAIRQFSSKWYFLQSYRVLISINIILFALRLASLLSYYNAFSSIANTIRALFWPALTVAVYIFIFLCSAAAIGTVLFGADTTYFNQYAVSLLTIFRFIAMYDFYYEYILYTQPAKELFSFYYVGILFVAMCVLLNMFWAVVYEAFDATKMYRVSIRGTGSQFLRNFKIIWYWTWPHQVIALLNSPSRDTVLTGAEMDRMGVPKETVTKIFQVYGDYQPKEEEPPK
eukprot:TRINITY_DN10299_c0_g4_i1.p1 TRINITY_DN10299_c0_g4~~TRINITY_DN10299_c0_g4_i1.p1  ORF type:complete len:562 (-),score=99.38 TRINITY_DN10299_c0_g4_i1:22-1629(-)